MRMYIRAGRLHIQAALLGSRAQPYGSWNMVCHAWLYAYIGYNAGQTLLNQIQYRTVVFAVRFLQAMHPAILHAALCNG